MVIFINLRCSERSHTSDTLKSNKINISNNIFNTSFLLKIYKFHFNFASIRNFKYIRGINCFSFIAAGRLFGVLLSLELISFYY